MHDERKEALSTVERRHIVARKQHASIFSESESFEDFPENSHPFAAVIKAKS
jgi:hypothetical protein